MSFSPSLFPPTIEKYNAMNEQTHVDVPENYNYYKDNFWRKKTYR